MRHREPLGWGHQILELGRHNISEERSMNFGGQKSAGCLHRGKDVTLTLNGKFAAIGHQQPTLLNLVRAPFFRPISLA